MNKIKKIEIYVIAVNVICYAISIINYIRLNMIRNIIDLIIEFPFDVLLISQFYKDYPLVNSLWFLSALLIALPWTILLFINVKKEKMVLVGSMLYMMYAGDFLSTIFNASITNSWGGIFRAFSTMSLGGVIYVFINFMQKSGVKPLKDVYKVLVTISGCIIALIFTYNGKCYPIFMDAIFCVIIYNSFTCKMLSFDNCIVRCLGKVSMILYILHWGLAVLIQNFCCTAKVTNKNLILIFSCIVILISYVGYTVIFQCYGRNKSDVI